MQTTAIEARDAADGARLYLLSALVDALCDQKRHAIVERGGELFIEPSHAHGLHRARRRRRAARGVLLREPA